MLSMRKRYAAYHMVHIIWKINTAKLCCIDLISKNFKNISALGLQSESMTFGSTLALGIWTWDRLLWYLLDFVVCLRLFRLVVCGWTPYPIDYDVSISSFGMDILSIFYFFCDVALNYCIAMWHCQCQIKIMGLNGTVIMWWHMRGKALFIYLRKVQVRRSTVLISYRL